MNKIIIIIIPIFDENLKTINMKKFIAGLSIFLSLHGLLGMFYFFFFGFQSLNKFTLFLLYSIRPYSFDLLRIDFITERINDTSYRSATVSLLYLFFLISFLIGAIIFITSKYKETRLLNFNYSLIVLISIVKIIYLLFGLMNPFNTQISMTLLYIALSVGYIWCCRFFILKHLNTDELQTYTEESNGTEKTYLKFASKSKRFLNLLIDTLLIIAVSYSIIKSANSNDSTAAFLRGLESAFGESLGGLVYFSLIRFIYYFVFESLFNATPGKLLTRCKVTEEEGNPSSLRSIFVRTFCRFIPFESISFLMDKNLHDNYSNSYVINQKKQQIKDSNYLIFLGIGLVLILVLYFYKTI